MPKSLDFQWNEGEAHGFDLKDADYQPPPAVMRAEPAPADPPAIQPHPGSDPKPGSRLGRLGLLAVGIALGMAVGLAVLGWQGQRAARADLTPLFVLQQQALASGDQDIYRSLFDDAQPEYGAAMTAGQNAAALLFDADAAPRLRRLRIVGDKAEAEVETGYQGRVYRRTETAHLGGGQWRLAPPDPAAWGAVLSEEGENVILHIHRRDASLTTLLPRLEAITQAFCRRYNPPPPCRLDLTLALDAGLLPFQPGEGALPPPTFTALRGPNGGVGINNDAWVTEDPLPLRFPSPRLVGLHSRDPHPLWWLGVSEAIGDVIARRAVGPVGGETEAVMTVWAALRGDVSIWAERFSGITLPEEDAGTWPTDPAEIGRSLVASRPGQRQAARSFALLLHARFGEAAALAWPLGLNGQIVSGASPAIDDLTIDQLRQIWRDRAGAGS